MFDSIFGICSALWGWQVQLRLVMLLIYLVRDCSLQGSITAAAQAGLG
jgi:hypothetical protein